MGGNQFLLGKIGFFPFFLNPAWFRPQVDPPAKPGFKSIHEIQKSEHTDGVVMSNKLLKTSRY